MTISRAVARRLAIAICIIIVAAVAVASCTIASKTVVSPPTYFLSPSGNDAAAGTSPGTAWRTLGRASAAHLIPGSRLLLQGGGWFIGQLTLGETDAGNPSDPVTIGSFGHGAATIFNSSGSGIYVYDTAGVDIQDLNVSGRPSPSSGSDGITVYSDLPAGHRLAHVVIDDVDVSGFANGIAVGAANQRAGFDAVVISDSYLDDNVDNGLITFGPSFDPRSPSYANQDVQVCDVTASQNYGDPLDKANNSGNGIVLGSVQGGAITWSTTDDNGGAGASVYGPAGMWVYDSTGITIEHNLSFGNKTPNRVDGNGFGLDQNTSDSVMQDNLSYDNYGTGYLVYNPQDNGAQTGNVVRDNVSSGDVRDGNSFYAGITVIGWVKDAAVYQNTVVMAPSRTAGPSPLRISASLRGVSVRDNIFSASSGPVVVTNTAPGLSSVQLQGNDYFSASGPWQLAWGPVRYHSLAAWRASTMEEIVHRKASGIAVNPGLAGPVLGLQVQTATDTRVRANFTPRPGSAVVGAGVNLASLGPDPAAGSGAAAPSASHPDIGAG